MTSKDDFVCAVCGAEDIAGAACSVLTLAAGYGSIHDMEKVAIPLCGECCDKLFAELVQMPYATVYDPW